MKTYKNNGEYWYEAPPAWKRIRQWFIWIGGWEKPNATGWNLFIHYTNGRKKLKDLTPLSLMGHRITFYGWGLRLKLPRTYFNLTWGPAEGKKCYLSPNGTPAEASTWFWGTPLHIKDSARKRKESYIAFQKRVRNR